MRKIRASKIRYEPTVEEIQAFNDMQSFLCEQLQLYHHDPTRYLFIKVDRAKDAFGTFIFQRSDPSWNPEQHSVTDIQPANVRPIAFLSRITSNVEKKYGSTEGEVAALAWAYRKFRRIIQSNTLPVQVLTDHAATKRIVKHTSFVTLDLNKANLKLANATNWLSQFELRVYHIPGKTNVIPDALSRLPVALTDLDSVPLNEQHDKLGYLGADPNGYAFLTANPPDAIAATVTPHFKNMILKGYDTDMKYNKIITALRKRQEALVRYEEARC